MQNVYLDPLDTAVLFGAPQPAAFQIGARGERRLGAAPIELESRGAGDVIAIEHVEPGTGRLYSVERKSGLRYTVYSTESLPAITALIAAPDADEAEQASLNPYLALPADLPPRIAELARKVTAGHKGPFAKATALERFLQTEYRYTLDLKRDERFEPLEDFLFVQRAGHCEYFASAFAVLLRAVGVPTR